MKVAFNGKTKINPLLWAAIVVMGVTITVLSPLFLLLDCLFKILGRRGFIVDKTHKRLEITKSGHVVVNSNCEYEFKFNWDAFRKSS